MCIVFKYYSTWSKAKEILCLDECLIALTGCMKEVKKEEPVAHRFQNEEK